MTNENKIKQFECLARLDKMLAEIKNRLEIVEVGNEKKSAFISLKKRVFGIEKELQEYKMLVTRKK